MDSVFHENPLRNFDMDHHLRLRQSCLPRTPMWASEQNDTFPRPSLQNLSLMRLAQRNSSDTLKNRTPITPGSFRIFPLLSIPCRYDIIHKDVLVHPDAIIFNKIYGHFLNFVLNQIPERITCTLTFPPFSSPPLCHHHQQCGMTRDEREKLGICGQSIQSILTEVGWLGQKWDTGLVWMTLLLTVSFIFICIQVFSWTVQFVSSFVIDGQEERTKRRRKL